MTAMEHMRHHLQAQLGEEADSAGVTYPPGGQSVAHYRRDGRDYPALSLRNPERHAERLLESVASPVVLISGFSGGVLERIALQRSAVPVISVEPDPARALAAMRTPDCEQLLAEERFVAAWGRDWEQRIVANYLPAVHGNLELVEIPASADAERREMIATGIAGIRYRLAADLATQGAFGLLWLRNSVCNLLALCRTHTHQHPGTRLKEALHSSLLDDGRSARALVGQSAFICGAGPGLDRFLSRAQRQRPAGLVLAADTALPALRSAGVEPDLVASIDPQAIAATHFRRGLPESTVLALELTARPLPPPLQHQSILFSGPSPFSRYLGEGIARTVKLSAGTVGELLAAIAVQLKLQVTETPGMDFGYPGRIPYAAQTSVLLHSRDYARRLHPAETSAAGILFRHPLQGAPGSPGTEQLSAYRQAFAEALTTGGRETAGTRGADRQAGPGPGSSPKALIQGRLEAHRDQVRVMQFSDVVMRRSLSALMLVPGMVARQRRENSLESGPEAAFAAERLRQLEICGLALSLSAGAWSV